MQPITNSPIKESMRQKNINDAKIKEEQIRKELNEKLSHLVFSDKSTNGICGIIIVFLGLFFALFDGFGGLILGVLIGFGVSFFINIGIHKSLREEAEQRIRYIYSEADELTLRQIKAYNNEVKQYSNKLLKNTESISPMVQHNVDMFQRMVSHANSASNMRFIESDFTFKVTRTGIIYRYNSQYTNPQDDFDFDKQRFRTLNTDTECEALASVLSKLTIKKMMGMYPTNSLHITLDHVDSEVTMHFKAANNKFKPATNIF